MTLGGASLYLNIFNNSYKLMKVTVFKGTVYTPDFQIKLDFENERAIYVSTGSEAQLTLLMSPGYSMQSQPKKTKVPISCKLSPSVAGPGETQTESCRLHVQCRVEKKHGGKNRNAIRVIEGIRSVCWMFGQALRKYLK